MKPKKEAPPKEIPLLEEHRYTPAEVAKALRVKERSVTALLRKGQLRGVKVGKVWRIPESALRAFMGQSDREVS